MAVVPRNQSPATTVIHNGASLSESDDDFWHRHFTLVRSEHRDVWCSLTERIKAEIFEAALGSLLLKCREGFHGCPAQIERRRIEASTYLADGRPEEPPVFSPSPCECNKDCRFLTYAQLRQCFAPLIFQSHNGRHQMCSSPTQTEKPGAVAASSAAIAVTARRHDRVWRYVFNTP
jgi:hypothetical protein